MGHPWIWSHALEGAKSAPPGIVDVYLAGGEFLARGIYDARSAIAVRVFSLDPSLEIGRELVETRIRSALRLRERLLPGADAIRVLHGEADGLPGVVCDRYGDVLVLRFDAPILRDALRDDVVSVLRDLLCPRTILERRPEARQSPEAPKVLWGSPIEEDVRVHEGQVSVDVDLNRGQKTGLYLDQRENHLRLARWCAGRSVLNLFSYTGGFGLHAAVAGAAHVTNVDGAQPALEAAQRNFSINGIDPERHAFFASDAMEWMRRARREERTWDVVIVDPPSFAPSERSVPAALKTYTALFSDAVACTAVHGILVAASCSSHVTESALLGAIGKGAELARRTLRVFELAGAGCDHPTIPAFPEGRYLKVVFAVVV